MGKQAKLKAERRAIREKAKKEANRLVSTTNPPDLGVQVAETINTQDKFGG